MNTQKTALQPTNIFDLNATTSTAASHNSIPSYRTLPPSYAQATTTMAQQDSILSYRTLPTYTQANRDNNTAKFKDLQSRAIQILIDEKPLEQIAYKPGLASFIDEIKGDDIFTCFRQYWFIAELSKYCVSDLCHDKIMIYSRPWKNNFLTKILNTFSLKKHIFKLNANEFDLTDIKTLDNNLKQQIAIMLLNTYNSGDTIGLGVACTSIKIVKLLHQTSLTPENQVTVLHKFIQQFSQFAHNNLHNTTLLFSFDKPLYALVNNLEKYIQQQKTVELNNEFYMSVFNDYFRTIENDFL